MKRSPETARETPICVAIVLCGDIIEDKRTNNKTLVSLFNGIASQQLPFTHPRICVMASLTSGGGKWPISFSLRSPSGKEIVRVDGEAVFADPLAVMDIVVELNGVVFEEEGTYFMDLLTKDHLLSNRRFTVTRLIAGPPPNQFPPQLPQK